MDTGKSVGRPGERRRRAVVGGAGERALSRLFTAPLEEVMDGVRCFGDSQNEDNGGGHPSQGSGSD